MANEENIYNAVKVSTDPEGFVLLNRDEKKEHDELRRILLKLTAFQIRFIEAYIRTASPAKAAREAGSTSVTPEVVGYKLLQMPDIQKAIAIAMKKRIEAVGLDTIEVIQKTREVYDAAMMANNFNAANKACELLMKQIELASHIGSVNLKGNVTKAGEKMLKKETEVSQEELERVLSIVSRKSTQEQPQDTLSEILP